jgi:16S rRNA (adenine1518-N6/adenine1519-N6)-dimethyltransferase
MELTSTKTIKEILDRYDAKPSKGLGQNFLIDKNALGKIVEAADLKSDDTILEVGPGIGVLTLELAKKSGRLIAVEKDKKMCEILKNTLNDFKNIEIINDDILKIDTTNLGLQALKYKIVANIPYYLTSPLIRFFLENKNPPKEIILMVQKEVAQRICSKPPKMSLLAVSVQFYADPKIISYVSKSCFWPSPKIDSAIIKITPIKKYCDKISPDLFFKVVKAGFLHPRKQLVNNLASLKLLNDVKLIKEQIISWLSKNNIAPNQRAESLTIEDWLNLTKDFKNL